MKRDAEATRQRILNAAIDEFSAHGLAGARVDRIAAASQANKQLIYAYYDSKEGLFGAVFDAVVVQTIDEVPMDARDLPEYAARLYDQHRKRPQPVRIGNWDWLERDAAGMSATSVRAAYRDKLDAIRQAQSDGQISDRYPAATLLEFVLALSRIGSTTAPAPGARAAAAQRRAIKSAVAQLTAP